MNARHQCSKLLATSMLLSGLVATSVPGLAANEPAGASTTVPPASDSTKHDSLFEQLDSNRDGYVSRNEATRQPRFADAFRQADEDRDNRLSRGEFVKARGIYDRERLAAYAKDTLITAKVKAAFVKDPVVSALEVSVETTDGNVLLSGFVESEKQVRRARELAAKVDGVKQVYVSLVVNG